VPDVVKELEAALDISETSAKEDPYADPPQRSVGVRRLADLV
jgi:hypothetical protein